MHFSLKIPTICEEKQLVFSQRFDQNTIFFSLGPLGLNFI